jgi:CBS domain containing-hemolysin-like protein
MEAVLLSINPIRLETLKQQGRRFAAGWLDLKQNIGRPIAAILILNTIAHTGGATIAGGAFDEIYGDEWLWLFSVVFTVAILFGTEILPKVLGVSYNERLAPVIGPFLQACIIVLKPVIVVTELVSKLVKKEGRQAMWSRADIETIARVAKTHDVIEAEQESVILNAVKLREKKVESVMIPREWIIFLRLDLPVHTAFEIAKNNYHTRYPISESGSVDNIVGYINLKEMIASMTDLQNCNLERLMRPLLYVRADANLNTMLKLFISHRHHLAMVKDAAGKISGMVTLEDVLEEIVGEIEDEFDSSPEDFIQLTSTSCKVGGGVKMAALSKSFPLNLSAEQSSQTVAQWLGTKLQGPLRPRMPYLDGNVQFTVQQVRRGRVHQARIEIVGDSKPS